MFRFALTLTALLSLSALTACRTNRLQVRQIAEPDYPSDARFRNSQGAVQVEVSIGADGKVISARGSGNDWVLVRAAEENARQWVFGPFPPVAEFPVHHTITYLYKLEGKPRVVDAPQIVKTFLPDRIEIIGVPLVSDYPPLKEYKPIPKK